MSRLVGEGDIENGVRRKLQEDSTREGDTSEEKAKSRNGMKRGDGSGEKARVGKGGVGERMKRVRIKAMRGSRRYSLVL